MAETTPHYHYARGRRKEAIATARLYPGKGEIFVGDQTAAEYFNNDALVTVVEQPLKEAGQEQKLRISLHVKGGGKRGQADAARLAIARALLVMSIDLRPGLKKAGFLTRDPREKERMKPGLKKARKASQFSKR
ncbi:MAG: Ribosomal protein bacterial/plastid [Patescibacteria group bacterium]|jgi:small subunit ribosomal protein S9|nr:Ribosomal protein bacterial/plastid [Patescibacteria group bacterium]